MSTVGRPMCLPRWNPGAMPYLYGLFRPSRQIFRGVAFRSSARLRSAASSSKVWAYSACWGIHMIRRERRRSVPVKVGHVVIGGDHPVVVQSMTNTDTADADATADQVRELARPARNWCASPSTPRRRPRAVPEIRKRLDDEGVDVPLIGDFHYNGHLLLTECPEAAAGPGQVPHQPGQRGAGQAAGRELPHHRRRWPSTTTGPCVSASTGARWTSSC